jgi:pimeloyl-ACP methyl ester carboxylesterase
MTAGPGGPARTLPRVWLLLTCLALIAGCATGRPAAPDGSVASSAGAPVSPAPSPAPGLDGCLPAARSQVVTIPGPDGPLTIGIMGAGHRTVILSDESDENLCSWLPFSRRLTSRGYRVVLWDYAGREPAAELLALTRWVHRSSAARVVLVGASEGAKASLVAAARLGHTVRGVVSLSAETVLLPGIEVARSAARLRCPLLLVTSAGDPYGSAQAAPDFLASALSRDKRLVKVPGADHGTALLSGPAAATVLPAVLAFLRRALAGGLG